MQNSAPAEAHGENLPLHQFIQRVRNRQHTLEPSDDGDVLHGRA